MCSYHDSDGARVAFAASPGRCLEPLGLTAPCAALLPRRGPPPAKGPRRREPAGRVRQSPDQARRLALASSRNLMGPRMVDDLPRHPAHLGAVRFSASGWAMRICTTYAEHQPPPKKESELPEWQTAIEVLMLGIARRSDDDGARIGVMKGAEPGQHESAASATEESGEAIPDRS
jgi:hypothetical protein